MSERDVALRAVLRAARLWLEANRIPQAHLAALVRFIVAAKIEALRWALDNRGGACDWDKIEAEIARLEKE